MGGILFLFSEVSRLRGPNIVTRLPLIYALLPPRKNYRQINHKIDHCPVDYVGRTILLDTVLPRAISAQSAFAKEILSRNVSCLLRPAPCINP